MTLIVVGVNHQSAPLRVLERLTFSAEVVPKLLAEVSNSAVVAESVVISTCNRTEVYVQATRFHDAFHDVREALATLSYLPSEDFADNLYVHYDDAATEHLFGVAAGLDSAVLGEHEILGQVRRSWDVARREEKTGALLNLLFQRAIEAGKKVRTDTAIGEATASLSYAAVSLIEDNVNDDTVDDLSQKSVLLVGTGELGTSVAAALSRKAVKDLRIANRSRSSAAEVADSLGASVVEFDGLPSALCDADVLVTATGADHQLLSVDDVSAASAGGRELLIVDLAVPSDVDVAVAQLPNVQYLSLADLQEFANRGVERRRAAEGDARKVISEELKRYDVAKSARTVAPLIGFLHGEVEAIRLSEIERQLDVANLSAEQREAVDLVTKAVLAKVLHKPTTELKDAAGSVKGELLADAVRVLFDLS